jgi:hypothetical protein
MVMGLERKCENEDFVRRVVGVDVGKLWGLFIWMVSG